MVNNGSIASFFKPVPKSSQGSSPSEPPAAPRPSLPSALDFLSPTPPKPPKPRDRNAVIQDSDDDDDDDISSDDDLPDFFAKGFMSASTATASTTAPAPAAATPAVRTFATPKRRRTTNHDIYSSPLTINAKKKFDFNALLKEVAADNAVEESERRMRAALAKGSPTKKKVDVTLHELMEEALSEAENSQDESKNRKTILAIQRNEASEERKEWCFFNAGDKYAGGFQSPSIEVRQAFPRSSANGNWKFLAEEKDRNNFFEGGLPYTLQTRLQDLPDEMFLWIFHEFPHEKSRKLREEYLRLLGACPDQTRRLVDEECVLQLFQCVGASESACATKRQPEKEAWQRPYGYLERDWVPLQSVLRAIELIAYGLSAPSLTQCMTLLLRLGMDNVVRDEPSITKGHQDALCSVAQAVPQAAWNGFCGDVIDSLYTHTPETGLRWNAVSAIPFLNLRLIELRRRLALVFVLDDPQRGRCHPATIFSMQSVIDRVEGAEEFMISRNTTDYANLTALIELLGVAIGDGSPPPEGAGSEAIKQYDNEVDGLARHIKLMWSSISDSGAGQSSRWDAKTKLKDFERKLSYIVRSRPPPKDDIFRLKENDDEIQKPKQQEYMHTWMASKKPTPKTS
ncbi:hypothetical protein QBC35DRAFT_410737 [Podospora australis]|uniref:Uncharacterized protein n=1 Tax=Podospora australis TaxID=1536484 RepID=A0AAN6WTV2_9PEZI|nr:hypothetical protein QBC35DRAFT_410737 [Podospora australis]